LDRGLFGSVHGLPPGVEKSSGHAEQEQLLIQHGLENMLEAFRTVARSFPDGRIEEEPGVVRIASGIKMAEFNPVFVTRPTADAAAVLERTRSFMARAGVPEWRLVATAEAKSCIDSPAQAAGLKPGWTLPAMLLTPMPARPPPLPEGFRIRAVRTVHQWREMVQLGFRAFGEAPPATIEELLPTDMARVFQGYVGFVGKTPVATSLSLPYHGVGGIYFVTTMPEFRGRGYGAAMTWQAAFGGRRAGCRASFLQATEMGYPVYAGMGYRKVTAYPQWLARES
jgi:N-acetylglutamate synthase